MKLRKLPYHTLQEMPVDWNIDGLVHIPNWCFWWRTWRRTHAILIIKCSHIKKEEEMDNEIWAALEHARKGEPIFMAVPTQEQTMNEESKKQALETVLTDLEIGDILANDMTNDKDYKYPLTGGGFAYTLNVHPLLDAQILATEEATLKKVGEWLVTKCRPIYLGDNLFKVIISKEQIESLKAGRFPEGK
jgi:hypothetical protein